jgi:hypothetical protein
VVLHLFLFYTYVVQILEKFENPYTIFVFVKKISTRSDYTLEKRSSQKSRGRVDGWFLGIRIPLQNDVCILIHYDKVEDSLC